MKNTSRPVALLAVVAVVIFGLTGVLYVSPVNHSSATGWQTFLTVQPAYGAQAPVSKSFVIMITAKGFDSNASITVNQGDKVQITFIMDASQKADTRAINHHVIAIDGYNLQTTDINPSNPTATVTFTANQVGTFSIYCDTEECPIHALMANGQLEVDAPGGSVTSSQVGSTTQSSSTGAATSSGVNTSQASSSSADASSSAAPQQATGSGGISLEWLSSFLVVLGVVGFLAGAIVTSKFVIPRQTS